MMSSSVFLILVTPFISQVSSGSANGWFDPASHFAFPPSYQCLPVAQDPASPALFFASLFCFRSPVFLNRAPPSRYTELEHSGFVLFFFRICFVLFIFQGLGFYAFKVWFRVASPFTSFLPISSPPLLTLYPHSPYLFLFTLPFSHHLHYPDNLSPLHYPRPFSLFPHL